MSMHLADRWFTFHLPKDYINPMDINMDYSDDDNPLGVKSDFVLSLCELMMEERDGLKPVEKTIIDRCLPLVYQKYFADPVPENMPVLGDLYDLSEKTERTAGTATCNSIGDLCYWITECV